MGESSPNLQLDTRELGHLLDSGCVLARLLRQGGHVSVRPSRQRQRSKGQAMCTARELHVGCVPGEEDGARKGAELAYKRATMARCR